MRFLFVYVKKVQPFLTAVPHYLNLLFSITTSNDISGKANTIYA